MRVFQSDLSAQLVKEGEMKRVDCTVEWSGVEGREVEVVRVV